MAAEFDGRAYQARFDELSASGADVHGEAHLVRSFRPTSVLDAGCGTGRVAAELSRHDIDTVGVDVDESMLAEARRVAPQGTWVRADLATLSLGRTFDVVVLAGNVPIFCPVADREGSSRRARGTCATVVGWSLASSSSGATSSPSTTRPAPPPDWCWSIGGRRGDARCSRATAATPCPCIVGRCSPRGVTPARARSSDGSWAGPDLTFAATPGSARIDGPFATEVAGTRRSDTTARSWPASAL